MTVGGVSKSIEGLDTSTVSNNTVYSNAGHGLWFDTSNDGNIITGNVSAFNNIGIFVEIGADNVITYNHSFGNHSQGMQLKGSNNTVLGNVFLGNKGFGLVMPNDTRQIYPGDRKSTRLNSSHVKISYALFC